MKQSCIELWQKSTYWKEIILFCWYIGNRHFDFQNDFLSKIIRIFLNRNHWTVWSYAPFFVIHIFWPLQFLKLSVLIFGQRYMNLISYPIIGNLTTRTAILKSEFRFTFNFISQFHMRRAIDPNLKYITILKYNNVNQDITFNTQSNYGVCIWTLKINHFFTRLEICKN